MDEDLMQPMRPIDEPPIDDDGDREPLPPAITQVAPIAGALAGGITATLTGRGFQSGAEVYFGASQSPQVTYISPFRVQAIVPAAAQTGSVHVMLVNPDGSEATKAGGFTYVTTEASLHAEVLGVTPLAVIEDTETEVTIRGRNLLDAYTNGMVALRGPTRATVSILSFRSTRDEATGIEDLIFTLHITASTPLGTLERMAIQVLASRRPGAASDGIFESSRHFFTVLPKAIPVTIAFTPSLEPDRPTLVVVAGRNLEGCTLDFGAGANVYMQKSDDRSVVGVVGLPEGVDYSTAPAPLLSLSVHSPTGVKVAQYEMAVSSGGDSSGGEALMAQGDPGETVTTSGELALTLTPVPDQQMIAPTEQDSAVFNLRAGPTSSFVFDSFNFFFDIFEWDFELLLVNEVRLIPFFDGGGDWRSPVLAQVGRLFRVRGAGLLFALRIEIVIQIRVVLIIGFRFNIWDFGLFNEFSGLYPWAIGSLVISFRVIVRLRFLLSAMVALVKPDGRLFVIGSVRLSIGIDFTISPDGLKFRFDPDFEYTVLNRGVTPVAGNLLPCGGQFQLAEENGQTVFFDSQGAPQSFYFPRRTGRCCLPWLFNLDLVRFAEGRPGETVQQGFRTDFCLNPLASPNQIRVIVTSDPPPNIFPRRLEMAVGGAATIMALAERVNPETGEPSGELVDVRELGYGVGFYLRTPPDVLNPPLLVPGDARAVLPGDSVIEARVTSTSSRVVEEGEPGETFWPDGVLGFAISQYLNVGELPRAIVGTLPVSVKDKVRVEPTLGFLTDPTRPETVQEAPALSGVNVPDPSNPQQSLTVRELERSEPFQTQRTYVLAFRVSPQSGGTLPGRMQLKFSVTTVRMQVLPLGTSAPQTLGPLQDIPRLKDNNREFLGNRLSNDVRRFFKGKLVEQTQQFTLTLDPVPPAGQLIAVMATQGADGLLVIPNNKETPGTPATPTAPATLRTLVPPGPNVADRHVLLSIDVKVESGDVDVVNQQSSVGAAVRNEENFEEYVRVLEEAQGFLSASPALSGFANGFYQQLAAGTTASNTLLNTQGARLWNDACAEVQTTRMDDRPLYWARLHAIAALRAHYKNKSLTLTEATIRQFELPSRGLDPLTGAISFSNPTFADPDAARKSRRAIVTGFDPFFLPFDPETSNPSGLVALHLNKKTMSPEQAVFIRTDIATQGNWRTMYGADGFNVISDTVNYPSYAQVSASGNATHPWAASTAEARALQKATGTDRVAACWFATQFTIDVNLPDGRPRQVALYLLDWDGNNARAQRVEVLDAATNAVLDTRNVSAFSNGVYLVWELSGRVKFRLTNTGSPALNAVVSGVFFDTPPAGSGVYVRTAIFPVRYKDFDDLIVENAIKPNVNSVVMLMTCSRGGTNYDVDRFAARNRGPKKFNPQNPNDPQTAQSFKNNNLIDNNRDLKTELTAPPNAGAGDQYLESTLPYASVITSDLATRELPEPQPGTPPFTGGSKLWFILNQSFWVLNAPLPVPPAIRIAGRYEPYPAHLTDAQTHDPSTVTKPGAGETSFQGSGGNYLSNEIFYRTALLRNTERPPLPNETRSPLASGHFHLPWPGATGHDPVGTGPGLLYSVRTAAERFLKSLFRMRGTVGPDIKNEITFPKTDVNSASAPGIIKITNTTRETISVFIGDVPAPFAAQWPGPMPLPLPAGASFDLPFTFRPTTPGVHAQSVKLRDGNGELLLRIKLTGEGAPVFGVAGRVTVGSVGLQGVQVALSGSRAATTTTAADGGYAFTNLPAGGNYTVTPSRANYTFTPPSRAINALAANQTADFNATLNRHRIRGRVRTAGGVGIPGATVTLSGGMSATATTDATGAYTFADLPAGASYAVAASRANYTLTPASQPFNNLSADADFDFVAALISYTVSGRVTSGGTGLSGVSVALSGSQTGSATTDAAGNYTFTVPAEGNYTVTPSKTGYNFTPPNATFNNLDGNKTANFNAAVGIVQINGRVTDNRGVSAPNIALTLSGGTYATATTDSQGFYTFANVPAGGNYTVEPTRSDYTNSPQSRAYSSLSADQTGDFVVVPTGMVRYNVALAGNGATPTASSQYSSAFPVSSVNNGDRKATNWGSGGGWNDATANAYPDWVQIDFQGPKLIDEIDVFTLQDNVASPVEPTEALTFTQWGITAFDVQYWDGSAWATVPGGSVTGNNKVWRKFTFPPLMTAKIRVQVNNALGSHSRIAEIEVYGVSAQQRVNVARESSGATATASSSLDLGHQPRAAINGDRKGLHWGSDPSTGSGWHDATPDAFPDWLEITFAGQKTIDEIDVFTAQDNVTSPSEPTEAMTFTQWGIQDFDIEYWTGSAWSLVPGGAITNNNKVWRRIVFPALTTAKIRVVVKRAVASYSRIIEVEAWQAVQRVNYARESSGASATASSSLDLGRLPRAAINGDRRAIHWGSDPSTGSGWHDATPDAFPDWLEITFPGSKTIDEVNVFTLQDNVTSPVEPTETMTFTQWGIQDFDVEYWTGSAWAVVPGGAVINNNKVWVRLTFAPLTTTKIRVVVKRAVASYSRIAEVEAWGPAS